jgi:hypothetical protein
LVVDVVGTAAPAGGEERPGELVVPFPARTRRPAAGRGGGDPLAGCRRVPGDAGGLGRAAPQHVGPHVEIVVPGPRPPGEIDGGPHLNDLSDGPITRRNIAVRLLGLIVSDHRILPRIGPLEGQGTSAGTGRGRHSAGPPLALRCTAGPSLSEFVVVPVDHTHPL